MASGCQDEIMASERFVFCAQPDVFGDFCTRAFVQEIALLDLTNVVQRVFCWARPGCPEYS